MKTIPAALYAALTAEVTTLATCWTLTRTDGVVLGFTDHDADLLVNGVTYQAASGYTASTIQSTADLSVDNLDTKGILESGAITHEDVRAGRYDNAAIEIFMVDYSDVTAGQLTLRAGHLGQVKVSGDEFTAEVRGLAQLMQQTITRTYVATCDADLGDSRCKVALASYTVTGLVQTATDARTFADGVRIEADGYFAGGLLTWTSGANAGLKMEVKNNLAASGTIVLHQPMPKPIAVGDAYSVSAGCDKAKSTCTGKFNNAVNFRGYADLPGMDKLLKYPSQ